MRILGECIPLNSQNAVITNRMRYNTSSLVLDPRKHVAWHQAGSGATENHVFCDKILHLLKDCLLGFQILKHTLLLKENSNDSNSQNNS